MLPTKEGRAVKVSLIVKGHHQRAHRIADVGSGLTTSIFWSGIDRQTGLSTRCRHGVNHRLRIAAARTEFGVLFRPAETKKPAAESSLPVGFQPARDRSGDLIKLSTSSGNPWNSDAWNLTRQVALEHADPRTCNTPEGRRRPMSDLRQTLEIVGQDQASSVLREIIGTLSKLETQAKRTSETLSKSFGTGLQKSFETLQVQTKTFGNEMVDAAEKAGKAIKADAMAAGELRDNLRDVVAEQRRVADAVRATGTASSKASTQEAQAAKTATSARATASRDQYRDIRTVWGIRQRSEKAELDHIAKVKRERASLRREVGRSARETVERGHHAIRRLNHPAYESAGLYAAGGAIFGAEAAKRIVESTISLDTAAARYRMLAVPEGVDATAATAKARKQALTDSIGLGADAGTLLDVITKSVRDGVPVAIAQTLPKSLAAASQVMGGDPEKLTDSLAEGLQEAFSMKWIKDATDARKYLNLEAGLSNYGGNSAEKTEQFIQAGGLGHGKEMGLDLEKTMAYGSMLNASGSRTGQASARFMGQLSQSVPKMFDRYRSATESHKNSEEDRAVRSAPGHLGYGSVKEMQTRIMAGPEGLIDFATRLQKLDDKARKLVLEGYGFSEQGGAMLAELGAGSGAKGKAIIARAKELAQQREANDYLSAKFAEWQTSLSYMLKQIEAGWRAIESEVGDTIKTDIIAPLRDWWVLLSAAIVNSDLKDRIHGAIIGFVKGLGFDDVRALLDSITANAKGFDIAGFAKGLGEGIRNVADAFFHLAGVFGGEGGISAETVGKLASEMFGLSLASHAIGPVVGIVGSIASGILALRAALDLGMALSKLTGLTDALKAIAATEIGGVAAGLLSFAGSITAIGVAIEALMATGVLQHFHNPMAGKGDDVSKFLWGEKEGKSLAPSVSIFGMHPFATDANPTSNLSPNDYWAKKKAALHLESYEGGDIRSMISKASYSPSDSGEVVRDAMVDSSRTMVEVRDQLIQTNELLRNAATGSSSGESGSGGSASLPNIRYGRSGGGSTGSYRSTPSGKSWTNGGSFTPGSGVDAGTRYHSGGGKGMTAAGKDRVNSWMGFFMRADKDGGMGLSRDKAAAMVGMMQGESGQNMDPTVNHYDVNGPSIGTAQWHDVQGKGGRASNLKAFAAKLGKDWQDVGVQQQYWRHEAQTSHKAAWNAVVAAPDGPSALRAGVQKFEVPRDAAGEVAKRMPNYNRIMNGTFDAAPADVAGKPVGTPSNPLTVKIDPKSVASSADIASKVLSKPKDDDSDFKKAGGQSADASVTNNHAIHIHGVSDPRVAADHVVAHLERINSRTHDVDAFS